MKILPVLAALAAATLIAGCERAPVAMAKEGERAQKIVAQVVTDPNDFVGVWISPPEQTINDWIVVFTEAGLVAIDGPGLQADGTYKVEGNKATLSYRKRNGLNWSDDTEFRLTVDKNGLSFETGEPLDPPVKLVRSTEVASPVKPPSLQYTADPRAEKNPFALAWVGLR